MNQKSARVNIDLSAVMHCLAGRSNITKEPLQSERWLTITRAEKCLQNMSRFAMK